MARHSRRRFLLGTAAAAAGWALGTRARAAGSGDRRRNVLFIAVDDLKPTLGCYGDARAHTPNIDALAAGGVLFTHAYCQQAVCSPSRTSLMTGLRPDTTQVYELQTHFRRNIPDVTTLPQRFKAEGYHAAAMGKIYHGGLDDPQSWSEESYFPDAPTYLTDEARAIVDAIAREHGPSKTEVLERDEATGTPLRVRADRVPRGPSWEAPDCPDNALGGGMVADRAVASLNRLRDEPFFLAMGLYKPHLPFVAPKRYFDLYRDTEFETAAFQNPPEGAPAFALSNWGELRRYSDISEGDEPLSEEKSLELIRAYYAATSYTDAQIGRVLDELERLGLADNTSVVLWGDHGWHLGDHGLWCKHTNYEQATRAPLIFRDPDMPRKGAKSDRLVEFVDIYPTLCALCGVEAPESLEGISAHPLFEDPARPWKRAAFSQYPRSIPGHGAGMGHSMRTERYRYTEWTVPDDDYRRIELYDYQTDPLETANLAGRPDYAETTAELARWMDGGWRAALPRSAEGAAAG